MIVRDKDKESISIGYDFGIPRIVFRMEGGGLVPAREISGPQDNSDGVGGTVAVGAAIDQPVSVLPDTKVGPYIVPTIADDGELVANHSHNRISLLMVIVRKKNVGRSVLGGFLPRRDHGCRSLHRRMLHSQIRARRNRACRGHHGHQNGNHVRTSRAIRMNRLKGKVAIVTGAGTRAVEDGDLMGTGSATATLFAREGAEVILADIDRDNAERTRAKIQEEGGEAEVVEADVSEPAQCRTVAEAAIEYYGKLDILFNNVGASGPGMVTEIEEESWDRMMDVGFSRNVPYGVAKGGIISLTRHSAVHHGRENIRVNCVAPGHIHTTFVNHISEEQRERRRRIGPLDTEGTAWDVAWAAVFLASDESRWISGVVLRVDAGLFAASPLSVIDNLTDR